MTAPSLTNRLWGIKIDCILLACRVLRGMQNGLFRLQHRLQRWGYNMTPDPDIKRIFPLWPPRYL